MSAGDRRPLDLEGAIVVGDVGEALAAGSSGGSAAGASTDAETPTDPGTSGTTETSAASATAEVADSNVLPLVAVGIGAGLIAGAAAAWLAIRRRAPGGRSLVHAD